MIHTEIVVTIDSLSSDGVGVGRAPTGAGGGRRAHSGGPPSARWTRRPAADARVTKAGAGDGGRVVFVAGTAPGDTVRARVVRDKKRFLVARLVEVISPGTARVEPRCRHFGRCGGCHWQHLDYTAQLRAKERQLAETLTRIGALPDPTILPIVPCATPYGYRNRIQGEIRDGRYHQRERGTDDAVEIVRCEIADEAINRRLHAGFDGHSPGRVELAVSLPAGHGNGGTAETGGGLGGGLDGSVGDGIRDDVKDGVRLLAVGDDRTTELGFRQVNADIERRLIDLLADEVARTPTDHVVDLYCGRGVWTCRLAERCPERTLIGVDSAPDNIRAAESTKRARGLANVEFRLARVERQLGRLPLANGACIVDPPRAGLDRTVIDALNADPARRLWYVSCHPATLARDLALLTAGRYRLDDVQPLDMFPQTAHLECLARLSVAP